MKVPRSAIEAYGRAIGAVYRLDYAAIEAWPIDEISAASDAEGFTLLMSAVNADDASPRIVELLVRRGAPLEAATPPAGGSSPRALNNQGWTALHFAARNQSESIVRTLLRLGARVDPVDGIGFTPLGRCVVDPYARRGVVEALVEHGADPSIKNAHGMSPLDIATRQAPALVAALCGDRTAARPYSAKTRFAPGDRLAHPTFGEGTVRELLADRKIRVEFADRIRDLVHDR